MGQKEEDDDNSSCGSYHWYHNNHLKIPYNIMYQKKIVERITIVLTLQSLFHTSLTHTHNYKERWLLLSIHNIPENSSLKAKAHNQ